MEVMMRMNLKVLVVDDEDLIRNGVARKIERLIPNVNIVGRAADASEALELVKEHHPHIVITDIRMPEIDGLQFINMAKNIYSDIKFVVLSGFQDFEYARRAIRLGVSDYLLKPIDNQNLKEIILRLEEKLKNEENDKNLITELKTKLDVSLSFLKNKYLTDLVTFDVESSIKQIIKNLELLDISFIYNYYTVITVTISDTLDNYCHDKIDDYSLVEHKITNICEEILSSIGTAVCFENSRDEKQIIIIVNHDNLLDKNINFNLPRLCNSIISSINKFLGLSVAIGIGNSYDDIDKLPTSYLESYTSVMQKIILGNNRVIHISDIPDSNRITYFLADDNKMILQSYIKEGNIKKSHEIIDAIFNQVRLKGVSYLNIKALYVDLVLLFTKTVKEFGGTFEKIFKEDILSESFISKYESLDSLLLWIKDCLSTICNYILNLRKSNGKKIIEEVIEFINRYYYTDLNLNDLASKYFINSNYLSQLFKIETTENFVEYLTKIRIEKAKDLLKNTDLKSYKISELVGYSNPRYFSDVFQKNVGLTPTAYRQQIS
jgi:two-component system, response regulator YesN